MKTTIDLPEEVIQRAKIAAIKRKTTLKELIHQSLLRELDEPASAKSDLLAALDDIQITEPIGCFDREQAQRSPLQALPEGELPYVIDPETGFPMARSLNIPGFVPPTPEESRAIIERANEEEDLRRAGLLR